MCRLAVALALLVATTGCGPDPFSAAADIGPAGGTLRTAGGLELVVPPDALTSTVHLSVQPVDEALPGKALDGTTLVEISPADLVFAQPVRLRMPLPDKAGDAELYFSVWNDGRLDPVGGRRDGDALVIEVAHTGRAFVGHRSPTRTITISAQTLAPALPEPEVRPRDWTGEDIEAVDAQGQSHRGSGGEDGLLVIPGVPHGDVMVRVGASYLVTDASLIDLGTLSAERSDRESPPPGTSLAILLRSLGSWSRWAESGRLQLFVPQLGMWSLDLLKDGLFHVQDGGGRDSLAAEIAWKPGEGAAMLEGSRGDRLVLTQLAGLQSDNGFAYDAVTHTLEVPPFDMTPARESVINGPLGEVLDRRETSLSVRGGQYVGALSNNVCQGNAAFSFAVLGQSAGESRRLNGPAAHLLLARRSFDPAKTPQVAGDFDTGTMLVGMPRTGRWGLVSQLAYSCQVAVRPSGAGVEALAEARIESTAPLGAWTKPVEPGLTPVREVTIGGEPMSSRRTQVGASPTIAWMPPAVGEADLYVVELLRRVSRQGGADIAVEATLFTPRAEVRLPAGLLAGGRTYALRITALRQPGTRLSVSPLRLGPVRDAASLVTAPFSP